MPHTAAGAYRASEQGKEETNVRGSLYGTVVVIVGVVLAFVALALTLALNR